MACKSSVFVPQPIPPLKLPKEQLPNIQNRLGTTANLETQQECLR